MQQIGSQFLLFGMMVRGTSTTIPASRTMESCES